MSLRMFYSLTLKGNLTCCQTMLLNFCVMPPSQLLHQCIVLVVRSQTSTPWWTESVTAGGVNNFLKVFFPVFHPVLWITSLSCWLARGTRRAGSTLHAVAWSYNSTTCSLHVKNDRIWLLVNTITRTAGSQLAPLSYEPSEEDWMVIHAITHWFTRKSPGSDLSIISLRKRQSGSDCGADSEW